MCQLRAVTVTDALWSLFIDLHASVAVIIYFPAPFTIIAFPHMGKSYTSFRPLWVEKNHSRTFPFDSTRTRRKHHEPIIGIQCYSSGTSRSLPSGTSFAFSDHDRISYPHKKEKRYPHYACTTVPFYKDEGVYGMATHGVTVNTFHGKKSIRVWNTNLRRRGLLSVIFFCGVLLTQLLLTGCSPQSSLTKGSSLSRPTVGVLPVRVSANSYLIKQGDQIEISVWGYPEFNTTTILKESGTISIPLIGDMKVENLTKEQFTEQLRTKLAQYIQGEIKVNITISALTAQRVSVLGAVTRQENYPVSGDIKLLDLLSLAGGTTIDADLHRIKIYRGGDTQDASVIDVEEYLDSGTVEAIPNVRPGDILFVPRQENAVHEFSEFLRDVVLLFGFFRVFN
jgi:protein involved in polysaccharide export with SLBB domain